MRVFVGFFFPQARHPLVRGAHEGDRHGRALPGRPTDEQLRSEIEEEERRTEEAERRILGESLRLLGTVGRRTSAAAGASSR